jgi:23S rRNA (adenine2503-C2)-methyltransferase
LRDGRFVDFQNMLSAKHNLLGMDLQELSALAESLGERPFRGRQLFDWLYGRGVEDFRSMSDLSRPFRERLDHAASISGITPVTSQTSHIDGTIKFLFALADGLRIESVLIPPASAFAGGTGAREDEQRRLTLCVSTQVGCPLDCKFCATATMGFRRNLSAGEIVDQFLQIRRVTGKPITNVVFMGMGEPLMNYDSVMKASSLLTAGMGVAARRITVSTAGWAERIRQMGDELRKPKLAVSLHSAVDATRTAIMPVNRKFPLTELKAALAHYYRKTRQRVTYEVIFFKGINDTEHEVGALIKFGRHVPCKINVIPYHSIAFTGAGGLRGSLKPSPRMAELVDRLREAHLTVMVRSNAGEDIEGACGQLAVLHERRKSGSVRVPVSRTG